MSPSLLQLAEEPFAHLPPAQGWERIPRTGYVVSVRPPEATVEAIRLDPCDVDDAVAATRDLAHTRGVEKVTWWVGSLSTPADLAARLEQAGLAADPDDPRLAALALTHPPAGEPTVEVTRVRSEDEYLRALEIGWECFAVPESERAQRLAAERAAWPQTAADHTRADYIACVDGEPAGSARSVFASEAVLLLGGATLPRARGRGVYTALVHARWRDAVERGTPTLVVGAGRMSRPILERLGFERLGEIRLLVDRLG